MKKSCRVVLILVALNTVFGGVSGATAQQGPIAGGYAEASSGDPQVISAARFAVRAQEGQKQGARISLISIRSAEVQVVAGLNYRLGLRININGRAQDVTAVVYKNLRRQYSLSSWETVGDATGSDAAFSNSATERLVKALAEAYEAKSLGKLDAEHPLSGRVKIVIEHSLAADDAPDRFEIKTFRTLARAEQWLRSREIEELPAREARPLLSCKRGLCDYNFEGGILHNHLYLRRISYGHRYGRPYLKTIFLLDGD